MPIWPLAAPAACKVSRNSAAIFVFNGRMKRLALALVAALLTAGVVPGLASAQEIQVGSTTTPLSSPTCPQEATVAETEQDCAIVLTKTTAYETLSDGTSSPALITTPGLIDSFTLGVSGLAIQGASLSKELSTLDTTWGGPPSAELTVLRPVASKRRRALGRRGPEPRDATPALPRYRGGVPAGVPAAGSQG